MVLDGNKSVRCIKCGNYAHKIMIIQNRGYGSKFDCFVDNTYIPVCPECAKEINEEWFYEPSVTEGGYYETYPNEHHIVDFINSATAGEAIVH